MSEEFISDSLRSVYVAAYVFTHIFQNASGDTQEGIPRLENAKHAREIPSEPQQQKSHHFRQRSASDSTFSKLHLSKASFISVVILFCMVVLVRGMNCWLNHGLCSV